MNKRILKRDIVDSICNEHPYDKNTVSELYSLIFDKFKTELTNGNAVLVKNFGVFQLKLRKGKNIYNINTGDTISYDSHYNVSFEPGKELKNLLKQL